MQINTGTNYFYQTKRPQAANTNRPASSDSTASFASNLAETTKSNEPAAPAPPVKNGTVDFTNMTRQELKDWMSEKASSGEIDPKIFDRLPPYMVIFPPDWPGGPAEAERLAEAIMQNERVNFFDMMTGWRDYASASGNKQGADHWQSFLGGLEKFQC